MRMKRHSAIVSLFDAMKVDPRHLVVTPGHNVRDFTTPHAIESLAILKEQIRESGGVRQPLIIRQVGPELHIVSGHRRHRAVMELIAEGEDIQTVPAISEPRMSNDAERTLAIATDNSGEPLTQMEMAEVIRRLLNMGWEREKIRDRLGYKTNNSIVNFELLLAAPEQIRDAVRNEEIAPSTAIELTRKHGNEAAEHLPEIQQAAAKRGKKRASVRDVKEPKSKGSLSVAEIELRNEQKLVEDSVEKRKSPNDFSRLEQILSILLDFEARGVSAETMADSFGTRKSEDIAPAADWLYLFCDALRQKEQDTYSLNLPSKSVASLESEEI